MADGYTELEKAVVVLVENFYKYVSKHSLVKNKISKGSFRKMLQKELNHMLTVRPPPNLPPPPAPQALILMWFPSSLWLPSFQSDPPKPGSPPHFQSPVLSGYAGLTRGWGGLRLPPPRAAGAQARAPGVLPGALWGRCPALLTPLTLQDTGNRKAADKLIQSLDANHDGRISFDEYWTLIGGITGPIAGLIRQQDRQSLIRQQDQQNSS